MNYGKSLSQLTLNIMAIIINNNPTHAGKSSATLATTITAPTINKNSDKPSWTSLANKYFILHFLIQKQTRYIIKNLPKCETNQLLLQGRYTWNFVK